MKIKQRKKYDNFAADIADQTMTSLLIDEQEAQKVKTLLQKCDQKELEQMLGIDDEAMYDQFKFFKMWCKIHDRQMFYNGSKGHQCSKCRSQERWPKKES